MSNIKSIDIDGNDISINLSISSKEYEMLEQKTKNILILPIDILRTKLTTGKLGNSNRIMIPKKILKKFNLVDLDKKVSASVFSIEKDLFLVAKIKEDREGIPEFKEVDK
jgi:antitoxin component of MazEF toxin-antitoxin module